MIYTKSIIIFTVAIFMISVASASVVDIVKSDGKEIHVSTGGGKASVEIIQPSQQDSIEVKTSGAYVYIGPIVPQNQNPGSRTGDATRGNDNEKNGNTEHNGNIETNINDNRDSGSIESNTNNDIGRDTGYISTYSNRKGNTNSLINGFGGFAFGNGDCQRVSILSQHQDSLTQYKRAVYLMNIIAWDYKTNVSFFVQRYCNQTNLTFGVLPK